MPESLVHHPAVSTHDTMNVDFMMTLAVGSAQRQQPHMPTMPSTRGWRCSRNFVPQMIRSNHSGS